MIKRVYIIDYIGVAADNEEILRQTAEKFRALTGAEVKVLSNFGGPGAEKPFFRNQYLGRLWRKVWSLYVNFDRLIKLIDKDREALYVYMEHGNQIDLKFMRIVVKAPRHIINVRTLLTPETEASPLVLADFASTLSLLTEAVMVSNEKDYTCLRELGFDGTIVSNDEQLRQWLEYISGVSDSTDGYKDSHIG